MRTLNTLLIDKQSIRKIITLESDPALRNLLITQSYHDLATSLNQILGQQNANWCHFATWASRTAGTFIRNEEIPGIFRGLIEKSRGYREMVNRLEHKIRGIHSKADTTSLGELPSAITADVSIQITLGNLKVYSELAPLFAIMITKFQSNRSNKEKVQSIISTLKEGSTQSGGQQLLKDAVTNYFKAHKTTDPDEKAEILLLANGQVGLHEQIRLQPYIQKSIDALVGVSIQAMHEDLYAASPKSFKERLLSTLDHMVHPIEGKLQVLWEKMATRVLMTLKVPGKTLHLGKPLPPPKGLPLYPKALRKIKNEELKNLLLHYGALKIGKHETPARDWVRLDQRMRYIFDLFRSRQQVSNLFNQPFKRSKQQKIMSGF
ncbi:MAG: hypothetical protein O7C75_04465 [Verrucomicrobia bacterium]|nr:hypothetical protein [Verrucomicrobiota bacterium]